MTENVFFIPEYNLYYECISREKNNGKSIVLVSGGGHTGACYKVTPDGRKGWAYDFAEFGYTVYVIDWPGVGRSGYVEPTKLTGAFVVKAISTLLQKIGKEVILLTHSMSGPFGWKLLETEKNISKLIAIAPGPMGNIQSPANILNRSDKFVEVSFGPITYKLDLENDFICNKEYAQKKFIGNSKLFPEDYFNEYFSSIVPMPRQLIYERLNVDGSQLKMSETIDGKDIKTNVFIITGTEDADHPKELDSKIHDYLLSKNISSQFLWLGDKGIMGNGHMLMLEKNSKDISNYIINLI